MDAIIYPAYPTPPEGQEHFTDPELTVKEQCADILKEIRGPFWVPRIERGLQKAWMLMCGQPGPQDQDVYDIEFYQKDDSTGSTCFARLSDKSEAEALCKRLNTKDPALRKLSWLRITETHPITGQVYDHYAIDGRFYVIPKRVGPK